MRKNDLLLVLALPCIVVAVLLENVIGTDFTAILGFVGMTSMITYYIRGISRIDSPKYVAGRKYLSIGLVVLGLGTFIVSVAAAENILSSSGTAGIPLEIAGVGIFVAGASVMMLVFAGILPRLDNGLGGTVRMKLFRRLWFAGLGTLLTIAGTVASIAVFNTWRLYSFPLTWTILLEFVTAFILVGGIFSLVIAIKGKTRKSAGENAIPSD